MATKKVKMADVLWEAANEHLPESDNLTLSVYSCNAVLKSEFGYMPMRTIRTGDSRVYRKNSHTDKFLRALGCTTGGLTGHFQEFAEGRQRQGVRYMWLLLAMHVAEDENIEIEVER